MSKLCLIVFCVGCLLLNCDRGLRAQRAITNPIHPIPAWENEYYHQHYFTIGAGMLLTDFPTPKNFYFAYVSPDGKNIDAVHHMDLSSAGWGPGFTVQSGLDLALGSGFKVTTEANLLFERVSHSEGQQISSGPLNARNYSMAVWYAGAQAMLRKGLNYKSSYVTAGMSAAYYITDLFSGQYIVPGVTYDIKEQTSHYTFNPQQYYILFGGGFLPSHSDERMFSAEILARIPLLALFTGRTLDDYTAFGVKPVKLWTISLTIKMEIPVGKPIREHNSDQPADGGQPNDTLILQKPK
jgi:hypothetical protein